MTALFWLFTGLAALIALAAPLVAWWWNDHDTPATVVFGGFGFLVVVVLWALFLGGPYWFAHVNQQTMTCTVTGKDRGSDEGSYRVYVTGPQCPYETLANKDAFWIGKFNSADFQGQLNLKQTYQLTTVGYRIGFFSLMPNIIDYKNAR